VPQDGRNPGDVVGSSGSSSFHICMLVVCADIDTAAAAVVVMSFSVLLFV